MNSISFVYLTIDNDWAVYIGSNEGCADGIKVTLQGRGGVANGNTIVNLQTFQCYIFTIATKTQTTKECQSEEAAS